MPAQFFVAVSGADAHPCRRRERAAASKIAELCHFTFGERLAAMGDALRALPRDPDDTVHIESDRFRLEGDYFITRQTLGFPEGIWFLLPVEEPGPDWSWAYLSKCGSLIQSFNAGEVWHRLREPDVEGTLPESFDGAIGTGMFALV